MTNVVDGERLWERLFEEAVIKNLSEGDRMDVCALIEQYINEALYDQRRKLSVAELVDGLEEYERLEREAKGEE